MVCTSRIVLNPIMETLSSGTYAGLGTCGPVAGKDSLSLLTLVDMALALEAPKPSEKDHTYAVAKKHTRTKKVSNTDNELLLQKEKDHNYSFISKSVALRHSHLQKPKPQKMEPTRSSSEENLSNITLSNLSESSGAPRRTAVDDTSLNTSHKCFAFGKNRSPFHTPNDHTYPCIMDPRKRRSNVPISDAVEIRGVKGEPMAMDDSYLGSHSWPKGNLFSPFRDRDGNLSHTLPLNYKYMYDHTYAQGKTNDDEKMSICDDSECQNPVPEKPVALKTDHNYNKGPCDKIKTVPESVGHIRAPKLTLKNNRIDHNYSGFTGTFSSAPTQPQGSVESLDMDFSQSDTDSCEETEEEERRLAITSTISAWLQLRKDHPYSSI
ncbi:uncharacterized protein LOC110464697 [Mizuhopecten yessoensis]|uniref:Uncharacterized protein n=1 Tax=Mizuhopecten yessoensis TaxID=6573 RepID=A0A210PTD3_MIZYE|nr:uncharacterized protein LOC110464697 [Mizuhopecten yessoensis]OWF39712.1 hypothetical protein KP79_PYT12273 [Mizuhopecten yessoensis]